MDVPDKIFLIPSKYPVHLPENMEPIKNPQCDFQNLLRLSVQYS